MDFTPHGYYTAYGYMGYVPASKSYMLFATQREYLEYVSE